MTPDETGGPSLLRLVAKAALQSYVADHAPNVAHGLRRSASDDPPGLVRSGKRALAHAADDIASDPAPIVDLIEFLYDQQRTRAKR